MPSIAGTNVLYPAFRNSVAGQTARYTTRVAPLTDTLFVFFNNNGTGGVVPDEAHIFVTSYDISLNPSFANRLNLGSLTVSDTNTNAGAGPVGAASAVFTGGSVLTGTVALASVIVAKFITSSAASPLLAHYGNATGLALTPNGADVTVVWNASGMWKF